MREHQSKIFLRMATLVDPRFKNNPNIFSTNERAQNEVLLLDTVEMLTNPSRRGSESEQPKINSDSPNLLESFIGATQSIDFTDSQTNKIRDEVMLYLQSTLQPLESDPLLFWKENSQFPTIKKLVPKFLCPPPSSVEITAHLYSVIEFLRSNKQIWERMGTKLELSNANVQRIWDVLARQIWPIFATNIRHLSFYTAEYLDNLRRRISPTILTDLNHLNSIDSGLLLPDPICDDGLNATVGQALSKWVHTPTKDGQPKRLHCVHYFDESNLWINNFKELTLWKKSECNWLLKRCPIIVGETAQTIQWKKDENWDDNLNNINFHLWDDINKCIGPLSPLAKEEKADE
ncbi:hypothetical protein niasHS_008061 [Heterodera schachtii]|uniref:Uncharacterized protein n=1 Tax=Heterodera schachtii TaxID=97005 RepID=A0ABD2J9S2_HETSC